MKIIENKTITYLSGYLFGLTEIDGTIRENFARVDFFKSESNDILEDIKSLLDFSDKFIILEKGYAASYFVIEYYIATLLYTNPFGLSNLPEEVITERKKYSAFHIVDFLDIELLYEIEEEKELFMYHLLDEKTKEKYVLFDITFLNKHIVFLFKYNNFEGFNYVPTKTKEKET
jgi:hypothetical protein